MKKTGFFKERKFELSVCLLLLIFWIQYMIWCFPGNMAWDTGTSIVWFMNFDRSNANCPLFQNILFGCFYFFGKAIGIPVAGITLYCYLQMAIEVFILSKIIAYVIKNSTHKSTLLPLIVYFIVPAFPIYAMTMAKDSNFGIAILLFEYYAIQLAEDTQAFLSCRKNLIGFSIAILLIALFRNHAGYIPAVLFIYMAFRYKRARTLSCSLLIVIFTWYNIVPNVFGIPKGEIKENMSLPLQMVAYYVQEHPYDLTEEQLEIIRDVIDYEVLRNSFDPDTADPIKNEATFTEKSQWSFIKMWVNMTAQDPKTMAKAFYHCTNGYYLPDKIRIPSYIRWGMFIGKERRELLQLDLNQINQEKASNRVEVIFQIPILKYFAKIGVYSYIMLILTGITVFTKKYRKYLFCLIPLFMVFLGCIFSPVNGLFRYAYSMILSVPVVFSFITDKLISDTLTAPE